MVLKYLPSVYWALFYFLGYFLLCFGSEIPHWTLDKFLTQWAKQSLCYRGSWSGVESLRGSVLNKTTRCLWDKTLLYHLLAKKV